MGTESTGLLYSRASATRMVLSCFPIRQKCCPSDPNVLCPVCRHPGHILEVREPKAVAHPALDAVRR